MSVFDFLLTFHSFPFLSVFDKVRSFGASIGKEYPFPKMFCILLVGKYPKPSENPFDTYYTTHGDFAKDFGEI